MVHSTAELKSTGIEDRAVRTGNRMPDFELPYQHGLRRFSDYLQKSSRA
jgi:hypothetical protein